MKKSVLIILAMIMTVQIIAQQQIIFEESRPEAYLVKYEQGSENQIKNEIIRKISDHIPKSLYQTEFSYSYVQRTRIVRNGYQIEIIIELVDIQMKGDILYRGFNIGDILLPETISYRLNLLNKRNKMLSYFDFDDVPLDGIQIIIAEFNHTDSTNNNTYYTEVKNKKFMYGQTSLSDFERKSNLIDEYYNSDVQIISAFNQLEMINLEDIDHLYDFLHVTEDVDQLIHKLRSYNFSQELGLNDHDHIKFVEKLSDLESHNSELMRSIQYMIANLHEVYYDKGMHLLELGNVELAKMNFNKAINCNLTFAPAHFQLANIEYQDGNYDLVIQYLSNITKRMNPDHQTLAWTHDLAGKLLDKYVNEARKYNENNKFDNAERVLNEALKVCNDIRGMHCTESIDHELSIASNGKYKEYITKAEKAIAGNDLVNAADYVRTARIYYKNHREYLYENDVNAVTLSLADEFINKGFDQNNNGDFNKAIQSFDIAKNLCNESVSITCPDDLAKGYNISYTGIYNEKLNKASIAVSENKINEAKRLADEAESYRKRKGIQKNDLYDRIVYEINFAQYKNFINEGEILTQKTEYSASLIKYKKAAELEEQFKFTNPDNDLPDLIHFSAQAWIISEVSKGEAAVRKNNLSKARTYYKSAKKIENEYNLEAFTKTSEAIAELKEKIFTQECRNAQTEYDRIYDKALDFLTRKEFIAADKSIKDAISFANTMPDCEISTSTAENKAESIATGVEYQNILSYTEEFIKAGYYEKAINKYSELSKYFKDNNVAFQGIVHVELFDYFKKTKSDFVLFAVKYYTGLKEFDKALDMLTVLKERSFSVKTTKVNQVNLGIHLANRDFTANSSADPKQEVIKCTMADKWLKYLQKSYLKQWKKLS